jgi:tetratricopeptide (TPR) repeat protein
LLHQEEFLQEAEAIYRVKPQTSAILGFKLGVLMEDLRREADAIEAYRNAILHEPGMADAHFNISLVYERCGEFHAAFRHLLACRRLLQS